MGCNICVCAYYVKSYYYDYYSPLKNDDETKATYHEISQTEKANMII